MDPVTLAEAVTTFLISYLPDRKKVSQDVAVPAGKRLWNLINRRFSDSPAAAIALHDLESKSDDRDNQEAFAFQLKKALKEDPQFAKEIAELLQQAKAGNIINVGSGNVASGGSISTGNVQVGDDFSGNVVIGNQDAPPGRLAGDSSTDAPPPEKKK
jgi:hypothetical protein